MSAQSKRSQLKKSRTTTLFNDEAVLGALASPLRMEILQAFSDVQRLTVGQIAQRIGKPRGSLYYHVRKLAESGVLIEADQRLVGRRYETVYEVVSQRIAIGIDASTPSARRASAKLMWSTLRQLGREFEAALHSGMLETMAEQPIGKRLRVWLTQDDLVRIETLLDRIETICTDANARQRGRVFSMASFVIPLEPPSASAEKE